MHDDLHERIEWAGPDRARGEAGVEREAGVPRG